MLTEAEIAKLPKVEVYIDCELRGLKIGPALLFAKRSLSQQMDIQRQIAKAQNMPELAGLLMKLKRDLLWLSEVRSHCNGDLIYSQEQNADRQANTQKLRERDAFKFGSMARENLDIHLAELEERVNDAEAATMPSMQAILMNTVGARMTVVR